MKRVMHKTTGQRPAAPNNRRVAQDAAVTLFKRVVRIFSNPLALCALGLATSLYMTHLEAAAEKNLVAKIVARLQTITALRPLATWIHNNVVHFVGLVCFSLPILLVVPTRHRAPAALGALAYVVFVPQAVALDYVWQAGLIFAWYVAKESQTKWLVIGLGFSAYSLEWVAVKL